MTALGITVNVLFAILGIVVSIWYAKDQCDNYPVLGGIGCACIWAIVQIFFNTMAIG